MIKNIVLETNNENVYIEKNQINIIVGENNIGKTSLLNEIYNNKNNNSNNKIYYLDLTVNPFDDLIKTPSNIETSKSYSYIEIKDRFEKEKMVDLSMLKEFIAKESKFEENKVKIEKNIV